MVASLTFLLKEDLQTVPQRWWLFLMKTVKRAYKIDFLSNIINLRCV